MKNQNICPFCQRKFEKGHGNQVYCGDYCRRYQKKATQNKLYGIIKDFRSGFLKNYKLFENLLPKKGTKEATLYEMRISGFNENCFYGTVKDVNQKQWFQVANYRFHVYTGNEKKIPTIIITHE